MKEQLQKLPKELRDLISQAVAVARANNMPIYLVGGFVRDLLLGVKNFDLDIVVEGDGVKFAEDLAGCLKSKIVCHRRFGTATIIVRHDFKIDVATCRKEFYPQPGHLPVVSRGSLKDDLFRRDFSINALALDISCERFGNLVDFFGGRADLKEKKIRVLHEFSFKDDPTRILRAIRFEKRFDFLIEPKTLRLLREAAELGMLQNLEPQRTRDDLILMLKEARPLKEIKRLHELCGFSFLSPGLVLTKSANALLSSVEKQISWFKRIHRQRRPLDTWLVYLMALLDPLSSKQISRVCRRFAFRRGEEIRVLSYKQVKKKFILSLSSAEISPSQISKRLEPLSYEVILMLKAKHKNRNLQRNIENFFKHYNDTKIQVCGKDLHALGISPGPQYQKIFKKVLNAKLDGKVTSKEEELALIAKRLKKK
jgi:tRNA nucleotidyltransferase (CCA-adding enzyme)